MSSCSYFTDGVTVTGGKPIKDKAENDMSSDDCLTMILGIQYDPNLVQFFIHIPTLFVKIY